MSDSPFPPLEPPSLASGRVPAEAEKPTGHVVPGLPPAALSDRKDQIIAHRERQIEAMRLSSQTLFSHLSIDSLLGQSLRIAIDVVGGDAGSLQMYDSAADQLVFKHVVGPGCGQLVGLPIAADEGIACRVLRTGLPYMASVTQDGPRFNRRMDEITGVETRSLIAVPVKSEAGPPLGILQIQNCGDDYDDFDLEVLEVIAAQAAIAMENARLLQNTRKAELLNLVGDISHDIKNMLTPIQTGAWTLDGMLFEMFSLLDEVCAAGEGAEWVRRVQQSVGLVRSEYRWIIQNTLEATDRVSVRTKEVADAFKGEASPPQFEIVNFNDVATEAYNSLRVMAYDRRIEMNVDLDPGLPPAQVDRKQIYNALYNLLSNAVPETPAGGTITLRTRLLASPEERILVEVSDTGRGMEPAIRDRLFTDHVVSTKVGGTGLGTRIVADVVRRHRGTISVKSEPGQGTTFTILLPLRQYR